MSRQPSASHHGPLDGTLADRAPELEFPPLPTTNAPPSTQTAWGDSPMPDSAPTPSLPAAGASSEPETTLTRIVQLLKTLESKGVQDSELKTALLLTEGMVAGAKLAAATAAPPSHPACHITTSAATAARSYRHVAQPTLPQTMQMSARTTAQNSRPSYAHMATAMGSGSAMRRPPVQSTNQLERRAALRRLDQKREVTLDVAQQIFLHQVTGTAETNYLKLRDMIHQIAVEWGGSLIYLRRLASGDLVVQFSDDVHQKIADRAYPSLVSENSNGGDRRQWILRPSNENLRADSVVVEQVDESLTDQEVVGLVQHPDNAQIMGVTPEKLRNTQIRFFRFKRRLVDGTLVDGRSGRLFIGDRDMMKQVIKEQGLFLGPLACYCRPFKKVARPQPSATIRTPEEPAPAHEQSSSQTMNPLFRDSPRSPSRREKVPRTALRQDNPFSVLATEMQADADRMEADLSLNTEEHTSTAPDLMEADEGPVATRTRSSNLPPQGARPNDDLR